MLSKVQVWIHSLSDRGERQVLLLRTRKDRGEFWQPVTGGVEDGESPTQAALREAQEETGLGFLKSPRFIEYEFDYVGRWGAAHERVFELEGLPGAEHLAVKLDPKEHQSHQWLPPVAALGLLGF